MIVAISTSSPWASVALLTASGEVVSAFQTEASRNASGVCLEMLGRLREEGLLQGALAFAADTGPGSFIGARVAVTLAKTLAYAAGARCYGSSSFDLISASSVVAIPNRRCEWLIRVPGEAPRRTSELPAHTIGYGDGFVEPRYPHAAGFSVLVGTLEPLQPEELLPTYVVEPSISTPRLPYREGAV